MMTAADKNCSKFCTRKCKNNITCIAIIMRHQCLTVIPIWHCWWLETIKWQIRTRFWTTEQDWRPYIYIWNNLLQRGLYSDKDEALLLACIVWRTWGYFTCFQQFTKTLIVCFQWNTAEKNLLVYIYVWLVQCNVCVEYENESVIRQKDESQNRGNKKAKHAKFSEKQTFLTL